MYSKRTSTISTYGGETYGAQKVRCMQGFELWCADRRLGERELDISLFNEVESVDYIEELELHYKEFEKKDGAGKNQIFTR